MIRTLSGHLELFFDQNSADVRNERCFRSIYITRSKFSRNETKQLVQLIKIKPVMSEYAIVSSLKLKAKG